MHWRCINYKAQVGYRHAVGLELQNIRCVGFIVAGRLSAINFNMDLDEFSWVC